jgi:hypothetical protein
VYRLVDTTVNATQGLVILGVDEVKTSES